MNPGRKSDKKTRFVRDEDGVSPVIGVILMVAITVVMAAIVSSWSSSVKAPTSPVSVGLDISRSNSTITLLITSIDPVSAAPIPSINMSYQNYYYNDTSSAWTWGTSYYDLKNADIGSTTGPVETNSSEANTTTVIAKYKDGVRKVIYSQKT